MFKKEKTFHFKTEADKARALSYVAQLPIQVDERGKFWTLTCKHGAPTRSEAQNALYRVWLRHFRDQLIKKRGMSPTSISEDGLALEMQYAFLGTEDIETTRGWINQVRSTTKLRVNEMSEFMTQMEVYILDTYEIVLPHPEDAYYLAMGLAQPEAQ